MRAKKWTARVDNQDLEFTLGDVGPKLASAMLSSNHNNRKVKRQLVDSIATDMSENAFRFNGDTVRINSDGVLMDGQHRLRAIVASGVTVPMLVIRGFHPGVMDTVDQGITRTVVDILQTHGVAPADVTTIASTAAILVLGDEQLSKRKGDRRMVANYVEKNLQTLEVTSAWAKRVSANSPRTEITSPGLQRRCLSASPLAALRIHMIVHGADDATVVDFFEKIADLRSPGDEHESYRTLRTWLVRSRPLIRVGGGSQFPQMMAVYAALIHCYNRVSNGHTISRIRVPDEAIKFFSQLPKVGE